MNDGLVALWFPRGSGQSIAKKYLFVIFSGGGGCLDQLPPPPRPPTHTRLDPRIFEYVLFFRTCHYKDKIRYVALLLFLLISISNEVVLLISLSSSKGPENLLHAYTKHYVYED